jgi:hypothetical protein
VEISEADDYTKYVPDYNFHQDNWTVNGADFTLSKENFVPIKTYIDYGLDKAIGTLDENQKIDPLTPMLEYFGTLRPGEQLWLQYIIRADPFSSWRKNAALKIEKMLGRGAPSAGLPDDTKVQTPKLSFGEQDLIKGIERSLSKYAFECIIRCVYVARKDVENNGRAAYFSGPMFKPFGSQYFNAIKRKSGVGFDWKWQDWSGEKAKKQRIDFFNNYISRSGFYDFSWKSVFLGSGPDEYPILTSEALATLFHLPGRVSETSTIGRIESTKAEPPTNLPI